MDIAAEIRDILVFHLGCEEERLADNVRLTADLGADSLDIVEVMMSCEERFDIDIPNYIAGGLVTVRDMIECVAAALVHSMEAEPARHLPRMGLGQALLRSFGLRKLAGT
jgi:acyl carrier protein